MTTPNTFIIGAPKCGTTALAEYLAAHPAVFFSKPKEPFFWASDLAPAPHELRPENLDDYLSLFAQAGSQHRIVAEGSTSYLRSTDAVPDILAFNPKARFIVMLRNPVEVVQAFHMEQIYAQHEDEADFAKAWSLQDAREQGRYLPKRAAGGDFVLYRKAAAFANQIERFTNTVPPDQRHIIVFDDFKSDAGKVYRQALQFLDLPDDGRTDFGAVNASHGQRFPGLARFILYPPKVLEKPMRSLRRSLLENPPPGIRQLKAMMNVKRERDAVDLAVLAEVRAYFEPEVSRLSVLLERDLTHWTRA